MHERIDALVRESGIETPFLINQALVLARERRLHTALPPGSLRDHRLTLLNEQWLALRRRLRRSKISETLERPSRNQLR